MLQNKSTVLIQIFKNIHTYSCFVKIVELLTSLYNLSYKCNIAIDRSCRELETGRIIVGKYRKTMTRNYT